MLQTHDDRTPASIDRAASLCAVLPARSPADSLLSNALILALVALVGVVGLWLSGYLG